MIIFDPKKGIIEEEANLKQQLFNYAIENGFESIDEFVDAVVEECQDVWFEVGQANNDADDDAQTDALIKGE